MDYDEEQKKEQNGLVLKMGTAYILHSDHSIPPEVEHDTLVYFFDQASRMADRVWG